LYYNIFDVCKIVVYIKVFLHLQACAALALAPAPASLPHVSRFFSRHFSLPQIPTGLAAATAPHLDVTMESLSTARDSTLDDKGSHCSFFLLTE
jgi:hypothetical protein